jgi:hypothetical protein
MLNSNAVGGGEFSASLRDTFLSSPTYNPAKKLFLNSLARCGYYTIIYRKVGNGEYEVKVKGEGEERMRSLGSLV